MAGTLTEAWRLFRILAPILIGLMVLRSVVAGSLDAVSPRVWLVFLGSLAFGCLVYGGLARMRRTYFGYVVSCGAAGAATLAGSMLFAYWGGIPLLDSYGGDDLLVRDPLFWSFWVVCGGITGVVYGVVAHALWSPHAE